VPKALYAVHLRRDSPKARKLKADISSASLAVRQEVVHLTGVMEQGLIPSKDRLEMLDGWLETYALTMGGNPNRLLCDFDTLKMEWNLLALSDGPNFKDEAYMEACEAHRLVRPTRTP